ncbi:MAG: AMP-binding protein [Rhodocyclaceae bacterium]|nr:AMP-binding protein [Rhodocyclaceae bacterium]
MTTLPRSFPTVVHMLASAAAEAGANEALVAGDERLGYGDYESCVAAFAGELMSLGATGERVALVMGNSADICIALFATHAARAVAVPLNPLYTERELRAILADARPRVLIHDEAATAMATLLAGELGIAHRIAIGPTGRRLTAWRGQRIALPPLPSPDDLATLQYTGGTTGRSKGVCLSHRAIAINIAQREALLPTRTDIERLLCVMPLFHVYAIAMCLHNMVACRGSLIILPRFQPQEVLDLIRREQVTIFAGSPTLFTGLMNHEAFADADFSSLHLSYSGSAALAEELFRRWESASGAPVVEGYGQSEAGPVISFNPLGGERKPGSVGIPLPDTTVEIVDLATGNTVLPVGERGEIRLRGPQVMSGYRNLPEETATALRGGWLYTSDIGEFDRDGYLYVRDRKKEMVKVSGFNVFPREVEEVLHAHPAVLEAAVIGVADAYKGEAVRAFVVLRRGATADFDALATHCRQYLARYKVPSRIDIVAELPKTRVGKHDKLRLREIARDG